MACATTILISSIISLARAQMATLERRAKQVYFRLTSKFKLNVETRENVCGLGLTDANGCITHSLTTQKLGSEATSIV